MKRNFTLIEILAVSLLISMLAAIGIAGYSYAVDSSKEKATTALIHRISAAFEALRAEGMMPKTDVGDGTEFLMIVFNPDPTAANDQKLQIFESSTKYETFGAKKSKTNTADKNARQKAYTIFAKAIGTDNIQQYLNEDNQLIDGWGNPVYVRFPGKINRGGFDIISAGSDGVFGENEAATPSDDIDKYINSDGEWLCDDVANI